MPFDGTCEREGVQREPQGIGVRRPGCCDARPQLEAQCAATTTGEDETTSETETTNTRALLVELQPRRTARSRGDRRSRLLGNWTNQGNISPRVQWGQGENRARQQDPGPCPAAGAVVSKKKAA
jgi:hypothetical protein